MWSLILSTIKPAEKNAVLIKRQKPEEKPKDGWKLYTVGAATGTVRTLAKLYNVPYATVRYRMAKGLSLEEALTWEPFQKTKKPVPKKTRRPIEFVRVGSAAGYYTWKEES